MAVRGDDDTIAGSSDTSPVTPVTPASQTESSPPELVAARYQIVRWLGSGGMGRVYEALDIELHERVALKVLRGGLTDEAIERFRREVRLTRRIQHGNVARMFDIGDHEGDKFLTMELVAGEPLTKELGRSMPWSRLRGIAIQVCAGLGAAHAKGVIHRDLKPDNVLLERATDRAVITDFGIARSVDDASVTQIGSIVGTPRYMAPEQLAGRDVDARADLFSLGVMLFELATGTRPWSGDNAIAVAVAQATQPIRPIVTTALPSGFTSLLARCLELDPANRPASADEVGAALAALSATALPHEALPHEAPPPLGRAIGTPRPTPMPTPTPVPLASHAATSLAVLPLSCGPGDEYLADGIVEDLIDTLSSTRALRVRPAGVVRSRSEADPRELGRQLGVDHVIFGSLRRTDGGLRVAARLIGVADGFQIWAHRADCSEAEILSLSDTLTRGIAEALSTRAIAPARPTDPRAVDLYLRARAELRLFWGSHLQAAADLLDQAIELSPSSAPIAGARAFAATQAWVMAAEPALLPRARAAIERGIAADHPEAYLASASYRLNTNDPIGGMADLGTVLVRAPMLGQAHEMAGRILVEVGAVSEARQHFETAAALDPTRAHIVQTDLARLDALEGHWDRADQMIATVVADPNRAIAQMGAVFQARLACWRGAPDAMANAAARFAPQLAYQPNKLIHFISGAAQSDLIDPALWQRFLDDFGGAEKPVRGQLLGLQLLSEIALIVRKPELAFEALEAAEQMGLIDIVILDKCPLFGPVAAHPRFKAIRDRVAQRAAAVLAAFRSTAG
ncbi:MAG: hypothetical protein H6Q90_3361 [Deltaproteobacteria bacterium]|nr:hypothetical protein [Deltaproteobacteria bacterium]